MKNLLLVIALGFGTAAIAGPYYAKLPFGKTAYGATAEEAVENAIALKEELKGQVKALSKEVRKFDRSIISCSKVVFPEDEMTVQMVYNQETGETSYKVKLAVGLNGCH